jgi:hypothetical protein
VQHWKPLHENIHASIKSLEELCDEAKEGKEGD